MNQVYSTISQYSAYIVRAFNEGKGHVKDVFALSGEDGTVVAWDVTVWTTSVKGDTTDSANIIVWDIPFPYCNCVDTFDFDLHPPLQGPKQIQLKDRSM